MRYRLKCAHVRSLMLIVLLNSTTWFFFFFPFFCLKVVLRVEMTQRAMDKTLAQTLSSHIVSIFIPRSRGTPGPYKLRTDMAHAS